MTGKQIGYTIAGTAVAGLTAYFLYLQFWAKDKEVVAASISDTPKVVATKAVAAVKAAVAPKATATTVKPTTTTQASSTAPRKMGDKAFAGTSGANAYTSAKASQTDIYKFYAAGSYIGTYLGIEGTFTKIIVEESGLFSNTNVTVYVPTKDLTY